MSAPEHTADLEPKSKIKVVRNAKGDAQFEATVVEGFNDEELERIRVAAVAQYRALVRELGGVS